MHNALWILQILLGVYFVVTGVVHFIVPPGLPQPMSWMYELPTTLHWVAGVAEILGGAGLVLPGLTRIRPELTPLAALGLAVVMGGAALWHIPRAEAPNIVMNAVLGLLALFIAYGRWRVRPLAGAARAV
jgi:uncharacterized membrane protein YphA (DoxX/SURF4 family)